MGMVTTASLFEQLGWLLPDLATAGVVLVLAANLGSFLNVVVHRLPLGESVVYGGSHCPKCGAAIRAYDNVPVLGWLWLRGRCRDCQAPIALRYPLVEAVCGGWVGGIAAVQLLSGGRNLPGPWYGGGRSGSDVLLLHTDWQLVAVTLMLSAILLTILVWSLLEWDGHRVSGRWVFAMLVAVVVAALIAPALQPAGVLSHYPLWPQSPRWLRPLVVSALGLLAAVVLGRFGSSVVRQGLLLLGVACGWRAVMVVAGLLPVVAAIRRGLIPQPLAEPESEGTETEAANCRAGLLVWGHPAGVDMVVAAGLHQLAWRWIDQLLAWVMP